MCFMGFVFLDLLCDVFGLFEFSEMFLYLVG